MRVNTARKIDYWIGVPLCFILSAFCFFQKMISKNKIENKELKKLLFIELSEIGTAILAYPAFKKIKEIYPFSKIYFLIFDENSDGIKILNVIPQENIIVIRSKSFWILAIDTIRSLWKIRKEQIDAAIDLELFSRFSSIVSYLSGVKIRVGFHKYTLEGLYRGNFLTHKVIYNPYIHISQNFLSLIDAIKVPKEEPLLKKPLEEIKYNLPQIKIDIQEKENTWEKLELINKKINKNNKIILMHLSFNDKLSIRKWPLEYYLDLAQRILKIENTFIVFLGVSFNKKTDLSLESDHFINLIAKTKINDLINLFNISRVLISHDSGMIHLASLTGIYELIFFGPETPLLYAPLTENKKIFYKKFSCSPCLSAYNHRMTTCTDNKCLQAITIDEVYDEILKIIK
jgi:ADP-heptose:LPS heptosyltransferase